jgi:hypothetical protein
LRPPQQGEHEKRSIRHPRAFGLGFSSTPGSAKPIFRTVSKLIVLLGMGCDYPQEHERSFLSQE